MHKLFGLLVSACCLLLAASCLLPSTAAAQVVTPRGKDAAVYQDAGIESPIVAQVEADARWRLEFTAAEIPARLPSDTPLTFRFLLPARDTGMAVMARVRGPGKRNEGWVEPEKVKILPDPFWKLPPDAPLYVPMRARQVPPIRSAKVPAGFRATACSYLLLLDSEGRVAGLRPLSAATDPALEEVLRQFRFAPVRVEGEAMHLLVALRAEPR